MGGTSREGYKELSLLVGNEAHMKLIHMNA